MKIGQQLNIVVYACTALTLVTLLITVELFYKQNQIQNRLDSIVAVHSQIDSLRGRLWLYRQYPSAQTRQDAHQSVKALRAQLSSDQHAIPRQSVQSITQAANNVGRLLDITADQFGANQTVDEGRLMLFSRFNVLLQAMSEAAFSVRQQVMHESSRQQKMLLVVHGGILVILALLVTVFVTSLRRRLTHRLKALHATISQIKKGDLTSELILTDKDELTELADHVNEMKQVLSHTMVDKNQLSEEVARQTQQLREQQHQLKFLAEHDELTGLFNRRAFESHVDVALMRANRAHTNAALLFIDLNNFKQVNDTYGHGIGDELLKVVSLRLKQALRRSDLVGRLGGDEFIVWLDLLTDKEALNEVITRIQDEMHAPITIDNIELSLAISIGVSCFPTDGLELQQMMNQADSAMYYAKTHPGERCCLYSNLPATQIK
ncbi:diguanylate cyclase domain-containing protein [Salinivibrio sp. ES.052]|uniref:diguanylate cyclase domain-containing protein n=1 Tax=Salinivibrio sp. ES.052 TaxID=1882823 RepID=UPI00092BCB6D|nr:diguanylate cyclase [Salinivibrio sp. ES.052]SIO05510.1 diguanylate cyclase (GGDEF) domain-containing protein [Salinivibrio sp. ES.052]